MTVKVTLPIEVNDSILTATDIPEPDPSVGEEAWLSFQDRRDINIIGFPSGATSTNFGMYYDDNHHSSAVWFSVNQLGPGGWRFSGLDDSLSVIFDLFIPEPSGGAHELCGFYVYESNALFFWWNVSTQVVSVNSASIATSGDPIFSSAGITLGNLPSDHRTNNGIRIFTGGSNSSVFVVYSTSYTGGVFDRVTSERLCIITRTGDELLRKSFPTSKFGTIIDIAMVDDLVYATRISSSGETNQIVEVYDLSLNLVNSYPAYPVVSSARLIGVGSNGTVNITNNETNPSFEVLKASDLSPLKSYYIGNQVVYLPNRTIYQCVKDNANGNPSETSTGDAAAEWLLVGPSNRFAMFDKYIKNKTRSSVDFTVEITPGELFDTVSFFGINGVDSIRVEVLRGTDVIYDESKSFIDENSIVDWYSYFFYQLTYREEDVFFNIPPYVDSKLRVTFTGTGAGIEVGAMPFGMSQSMGVVCINTSSDIKDYSDVEYDQFGELSEIERSVVSYNTYEIDINKKLAKSIDRKLKDLRGKNALWVGDIGDSQQLITYGRYERSPLTYSNHSIVSYSVKVRGSI